MSSDLFIARAFEPHRLERWRMAFGARSWPDEVTFADAVSLDDLRRIAPGAIVGNQSGFTFDYVRSGPNNLSWLHFMGSGIERAIAATKSWPRVPSMSNGRGIHKDAMADYSLAMISRFADPAGVAGKTVLIIGAGLVGQEIARRCAALAMVTAGISASAKPLQGFSAVSPPDALGRLLPGADYVVLTVPLTPATHGLINARTLGLMKRTAILINIARGEIVDEAALAAALVAGTIRGAALDVFAVEPLPPNSPFWTMSNVVVTPHIAGRFEGMEDAAVDVFAQNLDRFLKGERLVTPVDPQRGY